jgi:hypothetical protein
MKLTGENQSTRRKTFPSDTLSTTNPTWKDQGSNLGLRGERLATNRLRYGTALKNIKRLVFITEVESLQRGTQWVLI